jgi:oxygen-dependent protoporphyrinogen oxidase
MRSALVVGAGLSGLAAAWYLADLGALVRVVEASAEPGGLIHTRRLPEGLVETAANAFVWTERVASLAAAIGVELVDARPESKRRYIFRGGRARRWPLGVGESVAMAARLGAAWVTRGMRARDEETVETWGHRVVGRAGTEWLVSPALQGIYGSTAERLSASAVFGARRKGRRRMVAPRGGMGQFIERLADRLRSRGVTIECGTLLDALEPGGPTIVATPAPEAARLLSPVAPEFASGARAIDTAPLATLTAFYTPSPTDARGFGVLFPRPSGVTALGVLFNAEIFPDRSALRSETWIFGGDFAGRATDDEVKAAQARDRLALTGKDARPVAHVLTRWPQALPVYSGKILATAREAPKLPAWVAVAGNYVGSIGVAGLVDTAAAAAAKISPTRST